MMKSIASLALVSLSLATSVKLETTNRNAVSNSTASCGIGYTYCGYILKSQKSKHSPPPKVVVLFPGPKLMENKNKRRL